MVKYQDQILDKYDDHQVHTVFEFQMSPLKALANGAKSKTMEAMGSILQDIKKDESQTL